jgi:hypothetical protein
MARLSRTLELEVRHRAAGRCEYCLFPESASELPFHIDHIIAQKHGGDSKLDNLAFACTVCNRRKSSDLSSFDPETGVLVPLFHPRRDSWHEHFSLDRGEIVGLTASARATVRLLRLNHPDRVKERLIRHGWIWNQ